MQAKTLLNKVILLTIFATGISTGLLATQQPARAVPPEEFSDPISKPDDISNEKGLAYTRTGEYKKRFAKAVREAKNFCKAYKKKNPNAKNLAIVSDIDETLLEIADSLKKWMSSAGRSSSNGLKNQKHQI